MSKKLSKKSEATDLAVAPQATTALAAAPTPMWGGGNVDASDIMIPKILLMQGLSDAVGTGAAQMGDIIESLGNTKLGDKDAPIEIIPIYMNKTWVVSRKPMIEVKGKKQLGSKFEYEATLPLTAENAQLEMEETLADGSVIRRDRCLNFYVLLANDLEGLPYIISFRRTSYTAGKKLATHFTKMQMLRKAPAAMTIKLGCVQDKNDMGTFYKFDIGQGRKTSDQEINQAFNWYGQITKGMVKVHDENASEEDSAVSADESGTAQY